MGMITPGSGMAKALARNQLDAQISVLIHNISRAWRISPWYVISWVGIGLSLLFFIFDLPYFLKVNRGNVVANTTQILFVLGWLLVVTAGNRTVPLRTVLASSFIGVYTIFGLVEMVGGPLARFFEADSFANAAIVAPITEELLKALPVFLYFVLMTRRYLWQPSATDGLLLGLAIGAGFDFHEAAVYGRVSGSGWSGGVLDNILPVILTNQPQSGSVLGGHVVWTALVGLTLGLANLYHGRRYIWLLPVVASALVIVDHGAINRFVGLYVPLHHLMLHGRLPVWGLLVGVLVTILLERSILSWAASRDPDNPPISLQEIRSRLAPLTWKSLLWLQAVLEYHRLRRGLHFAMWRWAHAHPAPPVENQEAVARAVSRQRLVVALLSGRMKTEQRRLPMSSTSLLLLGAGVVLIPGLAVLLQRTWAGGLLCVSCRCIGSLCLPPLNAFGKGLPSVAGGTPLPTHPRTRKKRKAPAPKKKEKKPDPCAGYQRGYDQEEALLDRIKNARKTKADAYNKALPQLAQLLDQFNNVAPEALAAIKEYQHLQVVIACANLVAELAVEIIAPELGIAEAIEGQPTALFHAIETVKEIAGTDTTSRMYDASGNLELVREWAVDNLSNFPGDLAKVLDMVNLGERMQELARSMQGLKNQYDGMQGQEDTQAQKVADAKAALDACHASQG